MKIRLLLLLQSLLILYKPNVCFTQVVDLGTATSFSLFTSTGPFTNDSTSQVVGNIGTNAGAITGFPPGTLIGTKHVSDSVSTLVSADIIKAFDSLNNKTCGMDLGNTLGNGQVLTSNIYCIHTSSTLKGNLTLNGEGNPNAIFIFRMDSAFIADTSSKIILINSASLCNVYWQIKGSFSLGANSIFQGTVLSSGAITLNLNSSLDGRALTTSGGITLHNANVAVNTPPAAVISASGPLSLCQGDSITLTASAANKFLWSTGDTTKSIKVRNAGSYTVTVTNACGKTTSNATIITVNPLPIATITANGPTTFCQGDSVKLTATGGNTFFWSTGDTSSSITVRKGGSYTVKTTNENGCSSTSAVTILTSNPSISANGPLAFCQGDSVILTASGGIKFLWSTGDTTSSITVRNSGSYTVQATDTASCKGVSTATVVTVNPSIVPTIIANGPLTFCQGDSVILTSSIATKYRWSTGDTTRSITVKSGGSFTVTDSSSCVTKSIASVVTVNQKVIPLITASGPLTFCQGDSVILTSSLTTKYRWSTGDTTRSITIKSTGSFTITDSSSCVAISEASVVTVNQKVVPTITAGGPLTFCQGDSVKLTASIGSKFLWSTGDTTSSITVRTSGSYTAQSTDTAACKGTSVAIVVTVNPSTVPTITANRPLTFCPGDSVILTSSAGIGYHWSNGDTTQQITVKTPGSYTVTFTGACGATSAATIVTSGPSILASGPLTFCEGDSVNLTASGGNKYLWSTGDTTSSITVHSNGTYTVQSTDSAVCFGTSVATVVIVNPSTIPTITANSSLTFCPGDSVILTSSSAIGSQWSTGDTTQQITVKTPGSYTVTNSGLCGKTSATTIVTSGPSIIASGPLSFCQPDSVQLTASGGNKFLWSTGDTTSSITVHTSGSYTVQSTDTTVCFGTSPATIVTVNTSTVPTITANGPLSFCPGDSVILTSSAGIGYHWSTGDTTQQITVKTAGSFTVITSGSCGDTSAVTIVTSGPSIIASGPLTFCEGDSVTLTSSGGTKFLWSTGDTTSSITVHSSGTYTVQSTDTTSCFGTSPATIVTVNSHVAPLITANRNLKLCIGDSVILTSSQGSSYLWNTGDTTRTITVKTAGSYNVTITGGCNDTTTPVVVTVNPNRLPTISVSGPTTFCEGGSVTLTASSGSFYRWTFNAYTQSVKITQSGVYAVRVYNECGYNFTEPIRVKVSPNPDCSIIATSPLCQVQSTQLCADIDDAKYVWSTGDTTQCINISQAGTYSVVVTTAGGCTSSCSKTITDSQFPDCTISGDSAICEESTSILSAPAGDNTYKWNTGDNSRNITISDSGIYTVTVTNANGCSSTCSKIVNTIVMPACEITGEVNICDGDSTRLYGPIGANSYLWSNGSTGSVIWVKDSGVYSLTTQFATGCVMYCSATVTVTNCLPDYGKPQPNVNNIIQQNTSVRNMSSDGIEDFNTRAFPNPFVNTTLIEFNGSGNADKMKVDVYNLQGQKVASLFEGTVTKNERRQVRFDANGLTDGIYYYRITDGKTSISKKLILMKN